MKFRQASGSFLLALDFFFQRLQQPRHGDQDRNSLGVNGLNNFAGIERLLEEHRAADKLRN